MPTEPARPTAGRRTVATRTESGSASLPALAVLVVVAAMTAGLARVGEAAVTRARADAVADVTALAAVSGGEPVAARVADSSGAVLVEHRVRRDGSVVVVVRSGAVEAVAAAVASVGTGTGG